MQSPAPFLDASLNKQARGGVLLFAALTCLVGSHKINGDHVANSLIGDCPCLTAPALCTGAIRFRLPSAGESWVCCFPIDECSQ